MILRSGVFPIAPVPFNDDESLDLDSIHRVLDCMIDQGVDGIAILANWSEQFLLSDEERDTVLRVSLEHLDGRVPLIATCSHYSTRVVVQRVRRAKEVGAAMAMLMPPYHGALMRGTEVQTFEQFARASDVGLPLMIQDAPLSGVMLSVGFLARIVREIPNVTHLKIETPYSADKLRAVIREAGDDLVGPFDGEEAITLLPDLDAGATGTMPGAMIPDLIAPIMRAHAAGDRETATARFAAILPLLNFAYRQCGLRAAKTIMMEGGVIRSDRVRAPLGPLPENTRRTLLDLALPLDPVALRWGR